MTMEVATATRNSMQRLYRAARNRGEQWLANVYRAYVDGLQVAPTVTGLVDGFHNMDGILRNKLRSWSMERDTSNPKSWWSSTKFAKGRDKTKVVHRVKNCNGQRGVRSFGDRTHRVDTMDYTLHKSRSVTLGNGHATDKICRVTFRPKLR